MAMLLPPNAQRLLIEQGLIPENCRNMELLLPADGPVVLRYEVFVTSDQLAGLALAFQAVASEGKEVQDR